MRPSSSIAPSLASQRLCAIGWRLSSAGRFVSGNVAFLYASDSAEYAYGEIAEQLGGERQVAHVDALVGAVDQRSGLQQRLVAVREEPVGHALGERETEVARVGEAGQDHRHHLRTGILPGFTDSRHFRLA